MFWKETIDSLRMHNANLIRDVSVLEKKVKQLECCHDYHQISRLEGKLGEFFGVAMTCSLCGHTKKLRPYRMTTVQKKAFLAVGLLYKNEVTINGQKEGK